MRLRQGVRSLPNIPDRLSSSRNISCCIEQYVRKDSTGRRYQRVELALLASILVYCFSPHNMEPEKSDSEPSGKRLMIREMLLENFKSYAGRQQVGPFHKVR